MTTLLKNVAIVGASGNVGQIILRALLDASDFKVTVLTRTSSNATFPPGTNVRKTDFSSADLHDALKGQDALVSAVGATGFGEQKKLIDAAIQAGVKRFFPSEFSSDAQNEVVLGLLPLFNQKKEVVDYLKSKESDSFTWTGLATSVLLDWGLANGFLGYDIASRTATIWDGGNSRFTATNEKQLGDAVVSVLQRPQATANQYLYISSVETSQNEILAALEQATSPSWTVTRTTTDAEVSEGTRKLGEGDFSGALALVRATSFGDLSGLGANYAKDRVLANELLGLKGESIRETVERVVSAVTSK
ncbi:aromatic alcohol reductase [Aspergillus lucknowensis]|uniref:Semialdehyde dehydrogenase NAD-binding domain-containing protein n=1 Tax=Aspergillus lucknowensis TaxID=176173 RepID=A0ABR4LTG5_9EURO